LESETENDGIIHDPEISARVSAENSPAPLVLGTRCSELLKSLGDERSVLPSLTGLYERRATVPALKCWAIFKAAVFKATNAITTH
jgi:hypothetical protein